MTNKSLHIGILRADDVIDELAEGHGQYPEMFESLLQRANAQRDDRQLALRFSTYAVNHGEYPAAIDEVDGYILTGSKSSVYDDEEWIRQLGQFIAQLHEQRKKMVGICFGHQMVAHALGGSTEKSEKGWGIGIKDTFIDTDAAQDEKLASSALNSFDDREAFRLVYSHQDQVIKPAPESVVLASNDFCPVAMTSLGKHMLTFQGHPEFSQAFARKVYDYRKPSYPPALYDAAIESMSDGSDRLLVANWMLDFLSGF